MLSISQFANRTGISPSALRFYERKGLLLPQRLENGYRVYAPEQVAEAELINSLREADVAVADIRQFIDLDEAQRGAHLARWREAAAARLLSLQVAQQYLGKLTPNQVQLHLHRWEEPSMLLWLPVTGPQIPLSFQTAVDRWERELAGRSVEVLSGGYTRTLDLADGQVIGEAGFRVVLKRSSRLPDGARLQAVPPTLFATLICEQEDERSAHRLFRYLHGFGFAPAGLSLERYLPTEPNRYQLWVSIEPCRV